MGCSSAAIPTAQGGTIVDGTYVLASATYYGSPCPTEQDRIKWLICGSSWQAVLDVSTNVPTTNAYDFNVVESGTSLTIQLTCHGPGAQTAIKYSATPTSLTLILRRVWREHSRRYLPAAVIRWERAPTVMARADVALIAFPPARLPPSSGAGQYLMM